MTIEKTYQPEEIEQRWYQTWEENGYFKPQGNGEPYCIMLPPPNVTGSLHMGHGFGFTLADILIRYHRMLGRKTLWQAGTDHAGIATQMVVERRLNLEGISRHDLGREAFVDKIWEWKEESGGNITRQLRRLGASLDWQRERFSMDKELSFAVTEVFIRLYDQGLIYRGKRLVNWDPVLLTAISDLEVVSEEEHGHLWYIRYPLASDPTQYIVIATTRPETMLGDVAVAVHPDDERFRNLIGSEIKLPLTERNIPIIADSYVDPLFGTGAVKITPAHDFNDFIVGERHQLEPINIFTPNAHINDNAPLAYRGLERFKARAKVIADLEAIGLIAKIDKHMLKVPRGDRSNAVIEPYLTNQWYVNIKPLAEPAILAAKKANVRFIPENWDKTYFQWLENIEDWCISRQLWWGHRIPIWYDEKGKHYAGHNEKDVRKRHQLQDSVILRRDEDVLDTWFSAGLWPFSTLGWPNKTNDLKEFYPSSVMVTAFDIIFFWVARMIMFGLKFMDDVPFREVYITGLIRDAEGHKMSKSKGNVLDPIDLIDGINIDDLVEKRTYGLMQPAMAQKIEKATRKDFPTGIEKYGTDALRFTFCSFASYTREIRFDLNRLGGFRNFCNKIWNAARYVLMNIEGHDINLNEDKLTLSLADQYILSRLQRIIQSAHNHIKNYRFDLLAQALYDFVWSEYCDWYLELSKVTLMGVPQENKSADELADELRGTRHTLVSVLETILRLLHPIMPFITEEIWQRIVPYAIKHPKESIMLAPYPSFDKTLLNDKAENELDSLKQIIIAIRTIRSEMNIAPGKLLPISLRKGSDKQKEIIQKHEKLLITLAKLADISWLSDEETASPSASAFVGELEIYIPLTGFINREEEINRLEKEIAKLKKELSQIENKLQNPQFIDKAPEVVVSKEKTRYAETKANLEKLNVQINYFMKL